MRLPERYRAAVAMPPPAGTSAKSHRRAALQAEYRLGWVELNLGRAQESFDLFLAVVTNPACQPRIRQDSLGSLVYLYSILRPPEAAIEFFSQLTPDLCERAMVLEDLANRYVVMGVPEEQQVREELDRLAPQTLHCQPH